MVACVSAVSYHMHCTLASLPCAKEKWQTEKNLHQLSFKVEASRSLAIICIHCMQHTSCVGGDMICVCMEKITLLISYFIIFDCFNSGQEVCVYVCG